MRRLRRGIEESLDIGFGSTGDDNPEPRGLCGRVGENLEDAWTTPRVATLVERINDKDKGVFRVARKLADEVKEQRVRHRPWGQV
jgi:hypothetical protein